MTWDTPRWSWRSWGSWQCPGRSCPTAWPCPRLINERMDSAPAPALCTDSQSWASQIPFSVSLAANYSFPVRQSVPNLAGQGLLKEIKQRCPLRGSLRNNILTHKRKLMQQCNVYQPLSLPMPEGLTINTWSIRRSFSADFFFFSKGIKDDTEVHENNLISMMSLLETFLKCVKCYFYCRVLFFTKWKSKCRTTEKAEILTTQNNEAIKPNNKVK